MSSLWVKAERTVTKCTYLLRDKFFKLEELPLIKVTRVSDPASLLFANEAFYQAFADKDVEAMAALWSQEHTITCIHPGWGPLFNRSEVLSSWEAILDAPASPKIECISPKAQIYGDLGVVICFEYLLEGGLVATNIFVREVSVWKMIHHQAGPTSIEAPVQPDRISGGVIH